MNDRVAHELIYARLQRLRALSYAELIAMVGRCEITEIVGHDGRQYQLQTQVCWDGRDGGNVRVIVSADDGGWRALIPLTEDFIIRPDGTFVGESFGSS